MTGTDALTVYGPLGVLGAFALWLIRDYISGLKADRDSERAYSRQLEEKLREQIIPLLTSAQQATTEATALIVRQSAVLDAQTRRPR